MVDVDVKELLTKMLTLPVITGVNFNQQITSKASGSKTATATVTVPDGYMIVPGMRPLSVYISGDATVTVTDRNPITVNGSTVSFVYWLYNPNNSTANFSINATILCCRVGGGS